MEVKTAVLIGTALDWAVAKCEGRTIGFNLGGGLKVRGRTEDGGELPEEWDLWMPYHPSTDWNCGGFIIDRSHIAIKPIYKGNDVSHWQAMWQDAECRTVGDTPLIAAMRCYVASKLGDVIEVPDTLAGV